MDRARHLGVAALEVASIHEFLDQVRRLRAHDVPPEKLAVLLVADDLDHAAVAVDGWRADGGDRDPPDRDVVALVARLLLGEAEARDLRVAERRGGDERPEHRGGLPS